jgi:hypothetical protein
MDKSRPTWRKSSHSGAHGHCVEAAVTGRPAGAGGGRALSVRDSKDPDGPVLAFTPSQWEAFIAGIKNGEFGVTG